MAASKRVITYAFHPNIFQIDRLDVGKFIQQHRRQFFHFYFFRSRQFFNNSYVRLIISFDFHFQLAASRKVCKYYVTFISVVAVRFCTKKFHLRGFGFNKCQLQSDDGDEKPRPWTRLKKFLFISIKTIKTYNKLSLKFIFSWLSSHPSKDVLVHSQLTQNWLLRNRENLFSIFIPFLLNVSTLNINERHVIQYAHIYKSLMRFIFGTGLSYDQ